MGFITPDMLDPVDAPAASGGGGRFITEDMLDPVDGPLAGPLSGSQKFAGGLANMIPLNLGDEIMAGIRTGADVLQGRPMGESYDANLSEIRGYQKGFTNERPILAGVTSLAGNAPLMAVVPSGVAAAPTLGAKFGQAALEGAGWGAAFGLGAGEGGVGNRAAEAGEQGLIGLAAGPAGVMVGKGLEKAATGLKNSADVFARKSTGARYSDYKRTANDLGILNAPDGSLQTLTKASLDDALAKGELGTSRDPGKMLQKVDDQLDDLRDEVGAAIKDYDLNPNPPVFPKFPNARDFIARGKVPADKADKYLSRLENLEREIATKGNGKLEYLQQQKISVGKDYKEADKVEAAFIRAVYTDLQKTIEGAVPQIGPLNKQLQKFEVIRPIFKDGLARTENQTVANRGLDMIKTTGGIGSALIAGSQLGAPLLAGGAAAAYLAGNTPTGQRALSGILSGAAKAAGALAEPSSVYGARALLSQLGPDDSKPLETSRSNQRLPQAGDKLQSLAPQALRSLEDRPSSNSTTKSLAPQFPLKNTSIFEKLSTAVEKVESAGVADAVSPKGAVGLMQVRPIAAREVFRKAGIDDSDFTNAELSRKLKDPTFNKQIGEAYLQMLIDKYGGLDLALAAYNAGPTVVDRLRKSEGTSYADIKDKLPAETRAYVPKVRSIFEKA